MSRQIVEFDRFEMGERTSNLKAREYLTCKLCVERDLTIDYVGFRCEPWPYPC